MRKNEELSVGAQGAAAPSQSDTPWTAGKWGYEFSDVPYLEFPEGAWVVDSDAGSVCTMDGPIGQREPNARLIAAAPDLAAACERIDGLFDAIQGKDTASAYAEFESVCNQARAAIALARGGSQ